MAPNVQLFPEGKILDGRRRFKACELAGVKPKFKDVNPSDPIAYVLSLNLHRRHLSPAQLSMVAARVREIYDVQAKERQRQSEGRGKKKGKANLPDLIPGSGQSRDIAGKAVGVSGKSVDHASRVLKQGTPALIAAVDADHIAVSTAARASTFSEAEQDALAERAAEAAKTGKKRTRPKEEREEDTESDESTESAGPRKLLGVGTTRPRHIRPNH